MKPRRILNQPTYKPRSYKFSSHNHILHKVHNNIKTHRSLKHKVITNQVHNQVVEANSFKITHIFSSDIVPRDNHIQQKHQVRRTERLCPWS
jgi:Na+/phosphate symporter